MEDAVWIEGIEDVSCYEEGRCAKAVKGTQ